MPNGMRYSSFKIILVARPTKGASTVRHRVLAAQAVLHAPAGGSKATLNTDADRFAARAASKFPFLHPAKIR